MYSSARRGTGVSAVLPSEARTTGAEGLCCTIPTRCSAAMNWRSVKLIGGSLVGCDPGDTDAATIHICLSFLFGSSDVRSTGTSSLPARKPRRAGSRRVNNGVYILSSAAVGSHVLRLCCAEGVAARCGWRGLGGCFSVVVNCCRFWRCLF